MKLLTVLVMLGLSLIVPNVVANAQLLQERGTAMVDVQKSKVSDDERELAVQRARFAAFKQYEAMQPPSAQKLLLEHSDYLLNNYEQYITETVVLGERFEKSSKTFEITVRISVNSTTLTSNLLAMSGLGASNTAANSEIVSLIVARSRSSVQTFKDRDYDRLDANLSVNGESQNLESSADQESIQSAQIATSSQLNQSGTVNGSVSITTETGGSVTRKADKIEWVVADSLNVDQQLLSVLTNVGLNIVPSEFIDTLDLAAIRADFGDGNDLSQATQQKMVKSLQDYEIPYVIIGTLDVDFPIIDPVTGNTKIFVTVNAKLLDLTNRFPRMKSAIGPIQFSGEGPTEPVARTNAIKRAAEQVGTELLSSMAVKGMN